MKKKIKQTGSIFLFKKIKLSHGFHAVAPNLVKIAGCTFKLEPRMPTFPVLANPANVLYVQPIAQGGSAVARAVASSLLYRYTGVNSGMGSALKDAVTPLQLLQAVLAEWLYVYASLQKNDRKGLPLARLSTALQAPFIGTDRPPEVALAASGEHVPSFVSLLGFLADWMGSVFPAYTKLSCGEVAVAAALQECRRIRPSSVPLDSPVHKAFLHGSALPSHDFIAALNTMFSASTASPHPTAVVTATGKASVIVRVRSLSQKQQNILPPLDFSEYAGDLTALLPDAIDLEFNSPDVEYKTLLKGENAVVCETPDGEWFPVFPVELTDAVFQKVVVAATAEALVSAISVFPEPSFAEFREVVTKAARLNAAHPVDQVKQAVLAAFLERFPASLIVKADKQDDMTPKGDTAVKDDDYVERVGADTVSEKSSDDEAVEEDEEEAEESTMDVDIFLKVPETAMTLYFSHEHAASTLVPTFPALLHFFENHRVVEAVGKSKRKPLHVVNNENVIVAECEKLTRADESASKRNVLRVRPPTVSGRTVGPGSTDISGTPCITVVFMREVLLAIALNGKQARELLKRLWDLHGSDVPDSNFDNEVSGKIITDVVAQGAEVLKYAARWMTGVLAEIIIPGHHLQQVVDLVADLHESLEVSVMEYEGRTLVGKKKKVGAATVAVHAELQPDGETGMRLKPLKKPLLIDVHDLDCHVTPCLLGFLITSTQVSLLKTFGQPKMCRSVLDILKSIDTDDIPDPELTTVMFKDAKTLKRLLSI